MSENLKFLLLQSRNLDDPMRLQEVRCFASALQCRTEQIDTHQVIAGKPYQEQLESADVILLGGSGDYSVVEGGAWIDDVVATLQWLYDNSKPTFASCWGFQAFALALGGKVVTDLRRAELGTIDLTLSKSGERDPVFGILPVQFPGCLGHQDIVEMLPANAVLLASSQRVENEAFTFPGKPIYCTQFHPELSLPAFMERVRAYPRYIEKLSGLSLEDFERNCRPTPDTSKLIRQFVDVHLG